MNLLTKIFIIFSSCLFIVAGLFAFVISISRNSVFIIDNWAIGFALVSLGLLQIRPLRGYVKRTFPKVSNKIFNMGLIVGWLFFFLFAGLYYLDIFILLWFLMFPFSFGYG